MSARSTGPVKEDDLKLIHGIGPGIEKRLNSAQIHSYTQLAALTPQDLARILQDLPGFSSERIAARDWISQARRMAAGQDENWDEPAEEAETWSEPYPEPEPAEKIAGENPPPASHMHYVNFTVELWLNEDNDVHRTRVIHVQERSETAWPGWKGQKLVNFIEEHASLAGSGPGDISPEVPIELEQPVRPAAQPDLFPLYFGQGALPGQLVLKDMEVNTADSTGGQGHILSSRKPVRVHLTLDLNRVAAPHGTPLDYSAEVIAHGLATGTHQRIGIGQGEILVAERAGIEIQGDPLSPGAYRFVALVGLSPRSITDPRLQGRAFLEGGVYQVY